MADDMDMLGEVEDTEDGGAIVRFGEDAGETDAFYVNLAEKAPSHQIGALGTTLLDLIERDREARKPRDEQYQDGIKRTGLGGEAPGGASFTGASRVVHPVMTEACIDFAARTIKELWPVQGPVRDRIDGKVDAKKLAKAKRKTALMNWQLTTQVQNFRSELEQLLTQVPLGGGQYMKLRWDKKGNRPEPLFVAIDDMLLPFSASSFYSAHRKTHVQYLTKQEFDQRVRDGMYIDVDLPSPSGEPEPSASGASSDRIEGRTPSGYNEDGLRRVYEICAMLDVEFDDEADGPAPYVISIDDSSHRVLSIYRNWASDDTECREELQWYVEWPFIPWRGAYPLGLSHIIGGLSGAATGALRALLDSAHIANMPTTLRLKGKLGGQNVNIQPTESVELEAGLNVDDIRKVAMPVPFNQPSAVLFQLLGFLIGEAKGVVRTSLDDVSEGNPNVPVGTTLARIEQGLVVYSAVFGRLHDSMARLLRILNRLNGQNLDEERLRRDAGELLASREDFQGPLDVAPVSDPNIFSEAQRIAQVQTVAQRAAALPQLYNQRKVEERILETLKIPNGEDLLNPQLEPKLQNAVNENVAASLGRPITAFPAQDHLAHLETHVAYMMSPMFGANPIIAPAFLPVILGHLREHLALWYAYSTFEMISEALGMDVGDLLHEIKEDEEETDADAEGRALDAALREAAVLALADGQNIFEKLPPIIQQAQELLKQFQPPMVRDPMVGLQQQEIQRKATADQLNASYRMQSLQATSQQRRDELAVRIAENHRKAQEAVADRAQEGQLRAADIAAQNQRNEQDNQTALSIAAAEIQSGENVALSTGTGINP